MGFASNDNSLSSDKDTNWFLDRQWLNLKSLIQLSETLLIKLIGTHCNSVVKCLKFSLMCIKDKSNKTKKQNK